MSRTTWLTLEYTEEDPEPVTPQEPDSPVSDAPNSPVSPGSPVSPVAGKKKFKARPKKKGKNRGVQRKGGFDSGIDSDV